MIWQVTIFVVLVVNLTANLKILLETHRTQVYKSFKIIFKKWCFPLKVPVTHWNPLSHILKWFDLWPQLTKLNLNYPIILIIKWCKLVLFKIGLAIQIQIWNPKSVQFLTNLGIPESESGIRYLNSGFGFLIVRLKLPSWVFSFNGELKAKITPPPPHFSLL